MLICGVVVTVAAWFATRYVFNTYGSQLKLGR